MINFFQNFAQFLASITRWLLQLPARLVMAFEYLGAALRYVLDITTILPPGLLVFAGLVLLVCVVHIVLEII